MNKQTNGVILSTLAIIAGIVGLVYNVRNYDRYYLAEPLSNKIIIVKEKPEYIYGGEGGTSRYTFTGNGYRCRFWISEGALDAVTKNDSIEYAIKTIEIGDTVEIKIRTTDNDLMQDSSKKIRVIGLSKQNSQLVKPEYVEHQDKKWRKINLGFAIFALIGGTIWKIRHYYQIKNISDEEA